MGNEVRSLGGDAVLVVGAGVAGLQASLDLADGGFQVYLVDAAPFIGGRMASLGRIFPTNECSLCTLSPKLAAVTSHAGIKVMTLSRLVALDGDPGAFRALIRQEDRGVDPAKCKGCGTCSEVCPVEARDEFNAGLSLRKAIYQPYPQAYPRTYVIDYQHCTRCGACGDACPAGAVVFGEPRETVLHVGAVILSPGLEPFDARMLPQLGYGVCRNVLTSIEFERLLSAVGPTGGRIMRPSDGCVPRRIGWVQCVGSRNPSIGRGYCSTVCCLGAVKAAMSAGEQEETPIETIILCRDLRGYAKGHHRYIERARQQGVRFVYAGVSSIAEDKDGTVHVRYAREDGQVVVDPFDMVVLSVGLGPGPGTRELAVAAGVEVDEHGFCLTSVFRTTVTSRPGVFAAGSFAGPRDIPDAVTSGSAAASGAAALLSGRRATGSPPSSQDMQSSAGVSPRVGVFVCRCGTNIGGVVDVPSVVKAVRREPGVVLAREVKYACAADNLTRIQDAVRRFGLNRVVVAACSPRTHKPIFAGTVREAGLNPYLCEMANIRDHVAWVHSHNRVEATAKAVSLVRGAVAKACQLNAVKDLYQAVIPVALVVGGGPAGMESALGIADQGFEVHLVERSAELGGRAGDMVVTPGGADVPLFLGELTEQVISHPLIQVHLEQRIKTVDGHAGCFRTVLDGGREISHGVVVLATGAVESIPSEYMYGEHSGVMTLDMLEAAVECPPLDTVFIQCVGSRNETHPYCSRSCCSRAVAAAIRLRERHPDCQVMVLYRDINTYGLDEIRYQRAREMGVVFIRYQPENLPVVTRAEDEGIRVTVWDPILGEWLTLTPGRLVLSTGAQGPETGRETARILKVPQDDQGFFLEAHGMLRPVDFAAEGVFLCGDGQGPKRLEESVMQGQAAAGRAGALLAKGYVQTRGVWAAVDASRCAACLTCIRLCPFNVPVMHGMAAYIEPVQCQGCGICVAECPNQAITLTGYQREQLTALIRVLLEGDGQECLTCE